MIVSSTFLEGPAQADGRHRVTERHTLSDGRVLTYDYLRDEGVSADAVMAARAEQISAQLEAERAAREVAGTVRLPLTKLAFESLFSDAEWAAIQQFNATYESMEALTAEQKLAIKRGLHSYGIALDISLDDPRTVAQVTLYEMLGIIAPGRAAEILNG